ncbi:3'-5' RNA helicase YTHDC2-like isoform X1 [Rhynchophorus ferrugineus]|uniref:3'-5' RNA helicase YTHDC2-like isoform X1 n=2 Tax=Rhynchophorus ferrugineus TaxID=354439 RepID=UPI003FCC8A90
MGDSIRSPSASNGKFKRPNKRFGVNKGKASFSSHIDQNVQEATPEHMRIEIDNIIRNFLDDHEKSEYIFPTDLNNLQRKYIHFKAIRMNLTSKSYGKEPNRQLHLKKKPKRIASQSYSVKVSNSIIDQLTKFQQRYDNLNQQSEIKATDKWNKVHNNQHLNITIPRLPEVNAEIRHARQLLPIFNKRQEVLDKIINNQVIIISSETGSGKTTQIPQYILENAAINREPCKIICTQPRRISALSAAERVAYERGEDVGHSVGYHIRLESKCGPQTALIYCTVGVLLRNIMNAITYLQSITHIIVDEIHERGQLSDFLLIFLKQYLPRFPILKVIIMSATVDTSKFTDYFQTKAVLTIPGRLYPIRNYFLEEILATVNFFTPQMRKAMIKLKQKQYTSFQQIGEQVNQLSAEDQFNFNLILRDYMEFSPNYDYNVHYEEATADLLQLFISENVSVDQQHSEKGWTALMVACYLGDMNFASKLCAMGARLDICDCMGKTAFDYAKDAEKTNILQLLQYFKDQGVTSETPESVDTKHLMQAYDMSTPDDFMDYELIVSVIKYIHVEGKNGAILIFLPGYDEIMQCNDYIENSDMNSNTYKVFFLHSSMDIKDQRGVFKKLPNQRKIVLSTNIAETSVTIPDVVYVIDAGKAKEKVYDSYNKLSALQTQWISKACAKQREGRAGRVEPGCCFKLYSSQRFAYMTDERVPEILRVSLEELCLSAKVVACKSMKIYDFLSLAPDPPRINSINASIENLQSLGALDKDEELTKLGEYLSHLTVEPRLGKMLIYSCIFRCLEPMLTLVAAMAHKDPFQLPPQANLRSAAAAKRYELISGVMSDHIVYLRVFDRWQEECLKSRSKQFCREYFVSESVMNSVMETRRQFIGQLRSIGFISKSHSLDEYNVNGFSWGLIKALMVGAYFPNVAFSQRTQNSIFLNTKTEDKVTIHNSSVCKEKKYNFWYLFDEMIKNRSNFMIRGVTVITSLSISLLCGVDAAFTSSTSVNIDNWLEFDFHNPLLVTFRSALQNLINEAIVNPSHSFEDYNKVVIETLRVIMDLEEQNSGLRQPLVIGMKPKYVRNIPSKQNNARQNNRTESNWRDNRQGKTPKRFVSRYTKNSPASSNTSRRINFENPQYDRPSVSSAPWSTNQISVGGENPTQAVNYGGVSPYTVEQSCTDSQHWLMNSLPHTDYLNDWTSLIQSSGDYMFQDHSTTGAELMLKGLDINDGNPNVPVAAELLPGPSRQHNGRSKKKDRKKIQKENT